MFSPPSFTVRGVRGAALHCRDVVHIVRQGTGHDGPRRWSGAFMGVILISASLLYAGSSQGSALLHCSFNTMPGCGKDRGKDQTHKVGRGMFRQARPIQVPDLISWVLCVCMTVHHTQYPEGIPW